MHIAMILAALIMGSPAQAKPVNEWHRWFAWYPVEVDAYKDSEIRDGKFRYTVWRVWVEYRWDEWRDELDEREWHGFRYRPAR